jgi:hypothetical protein
MEKPTLLQKLLSIRQEVEYIQKTEQGNQGAMYVDPAVLLKKIRDNMDSQAVLLVPSLLNPAVESIPAPTKNNKDAMGFLFKSNMDFHWYDCATGEKLTVPWFCTGKHMTDPAMAEGGALTYTERYFLLKFFQIPTAKDDPEFFKQKTHEPEVLSEKQVSEIKGIIKSIPDFAESTFLKWAKKDKVELIFAKDYEKTKIALTERAKKATEVKK